ncbi:Pentatricopeptide repeat-containing protein [Rhynchospora pubera]|uniref:Pentatricopeptide repeat-containing protein n=1 Tax=Rhynchospora pubera TaxID=906938 RepID=A0AAV8DU66_9POAL|nr:Pentatricopeptide repeat-containing protein [Rhynchospora pubera]
MPVKQRLRPLYSSLSTPHGFISSIPPNPSPPSPIRRCSQHPQGLLVSIPFLQRPRRRGEELGLRGASLPLPRSFRHTHNRRYHCYLFQAPPLLPPPFPLPPPLQALLLRLNISSHSLSTGSDIPEADSLTLKDCAFGSAEPEPETGNDNSGSDLGSEPDLVPEKNEVDRVCMVIKELLSSDGNMGLGLTECGIGLKQSLVVGVIDRFRHSHKTAYRFFCWAGSVPGFAHDKVTYNKMLDVLGRNRQFDTLVDLLEEMGNLQLLSMESFELAICSFASSQEIKRCLWVFQFMKRFGFDAGLGTFNCLLGKLVNEKLGKEAQKLFDKMSGQYTPNLKTYTLLLAGWCKVKNLVEAGRVWNEMVDHGFKPDIVAHNIMLEGLVHGQRRPEALKLFDLMKAKGPTPNAETYTIVIDALCKGRKMDLALRVFEEMQVTGCDPNTATYTCLLTGFGNAGRVGQALSLLKVMEKKCLLTDSCTYNALIKQLTSRGLSEEADGVYKSMVQRGFKPTTNTYNMIMKSYFSKNHKMGCQFWEEMRKKGICPNENSYTIFIGGHIQHGQVEEAEKYILEMVNKGMKAPQIDYNKFVADFSRAGKPNKLEDMAQKMRSDGKFEAADWLYRRARRVRVRRSPKSTTKPPV